MKLYSKNISRYISRHSIVLIRYIRRFLDVLHGDLSFKLLEWEVCVDVAKILLSKARFQEAHPYFRRLITLNPDANTYFLITELLLTYEKFEDAVLYLQQLTSAQSSPAHIRKLRYFLTRAGKNNPSFIEEALALPDKFGKEYLDLSDVEGYYADGLFFYDLGRLKEFSILASKAMEIQGELAQKKGLDKLGVRYLESKNWTNAIAHTAFFDFYAKAHILGLQSKHIVLAEPGKVANQQYLNYWKDYFQIISDSDEIELHCEAINYLSNYSFIVPLSNKWFWLPEAIAIVQQQWEQENRYPLLSLNYSDVERGWEALRSIGIQQNDWFVCLHVREPGFYKQWNDPVPSLRNSDIDTYQLAIQAIVDRGGWVVRVGDPSMKPLTPMKQVFDYATSSLKSDWMDIFLCGSCRFFVGTSSGLFMVSHTFGIPCVFTNYVPLAHQIWGSDYLLIPKLFWSENEHRYLTFAEWLSSGYAYLETKDESRDFQPIDNSPEDLRDVVIEMCDRADGSLVYSDVDESLQNSFRNHLNPNQKIIVNRMGREFLRKYSYLL